MVPAATNIFVTTIKEKETMEMKQQRRYMGGVRGRKWKEEKKTLYYYLKRVNKTSILKNRGNKVDRTISLKF